MDKYNVQQQPVDVMLGWIKSGEVAIPEIQRPFVWDASKVRDFLDSLYKGYPVGYIITWKNPDVRLKDGKTSEGKKVLIDGQQRITALTAAILGHRVVNKKYRKVNIRIAFNPIEERFEVSNPALKKNPVWIDDVHPIMTNEVRTTVAIREYIENNPTADEVQVEESIERLKSILNRPIGVIELGSLLDIDTVTEIFIRINSKGVPLSNADFVMSKIAADTRHDGNNMRKCIDYFSHLSLEPVYHDDVKNNDTDFSKTDYFHKISWLRNENDDIYDPTYVDILRVAFTFKFNRGKFSDLVALLSGRNFETRTFEEDIAVSSYALLKEGIMGFIDETNFKRFVMILRSAGFTDKSLMRSASAVNFAYALYLKLHDERHDTHEVTRYVKRWFVLSNLTARYSGSAESVIDQDIRRINQDGIALFFDTEEKITLSDTFWEGRLPEYLRSTSSVNPAFNVFFAAQIKARNKGFLSRDITVSDMMELRGDIHHIFPRNALKKVGLDRDMYNQVANLVYSQQEINIRLGDRLPGIYMQEVLKEIETQTPHYTAISDMDQLRLNMTENAIPESVFTATADDYDAFLSDRRKLMALKIKDYYNSL
jgi:hypothetical protein